MSFKPTTYLMVALPVSEVFTNGEDDNAMAIAAEELGLDLYSISTEHSFTHIGIILGHLYADSINSQQFSTVDYSAIFSATGLLKFKLEKNKRLEPQVLMGIHWS